MIQRTPKRLFLATALAAALTGLAGPAMALDADDFATITEKEAEAAVAALAQYGIATTPSGAAGVAAALAGIGDIDGSSEVLCIISEGPEDG